MTMGLDDFGESVGPSTTTATAVEDQLAANDSVVVVGEGGLELRFQRCSSMVIDVGKCP